MPNFRIIAPTTIGAATLSCATANTVYPASNLATHRRDELFRTTGLSAQVLRATWAANQTIQAVALTRHNLTTSATWRVRLFSDAAWTTLIGSFDTGTVTAFDGTGMTAFDTTYSASFRGFKNAVAWFSSAATTVRSLQIDLTDAGNTDGFIEAVSVIAGPMYEPPGQENFEFGHPLLANDDASQKRSGGGSLHSTVKTSSIDRSWTYDLKLFSQTSRDWMFDLARTHGKRTPFFLSMYPADTSKRLERDYQALVKYTDLSGFERPSAAGYNNTVSVGEC